MGKHYVDNKRLYAVLVQYKKDRIRAEKAKKPVPPIPNYIGECLLQIANRLSYKPNFANYMFREEMVGDGIENCINYLNNFNPDKSSNPFAYFTQIIYYAFLRRIEREKRQLYIKHKALEQSVVYDELSDSHASSGETKKGEIKINLHTDYMKDFVSNFEQKIADRKTKREAKKAEANADKGLDKFYGRPETE